MIRGNKSIAFLLLIVCVIASIFQPASAQRRKEKLYTVSLGRELKAFTNIEELPEYKPNTKLLQVSSYDRTGWNDDGFSGRFSFVRRNPDSSLVLLDAKGPGVINRIWTPTPTEDSLDFYIDDTTKPAFTIKYLDLFSGKVYPFVAPLCNNQLGGYYCYLPIPFRQHCKIVLRGKHHQFYQIGYRTYPQFSHVFSFTPELNLEDKTALQHLQAKWNPKSPSIHDFVATGDKNALQTAKATFQLKEGERKTIMQLSKGGRITGIELEPATAFEGWAKEVDLKITWDGEATPAVYCPVADFFGFAFGKPSMQSLLIGTRNNTAYCYFPMPFDKGAKIELEYRGTSFRSTRQSITITALVFHLPNKRVAASEGKFYSYWNHQPSVVRGQPHLLLQTTGKGHYVGTVLQARGHETGMTGFFEGDDSTVVDGELTMHGTGSEDYFNGGWYAMMDRWDAAFSLPLSGSLDYMLPLSRTGGYRLFLTDKIPFTNSIHHSIEHGPEHNLLPGTYTSVAYYYGDKPPGNIISPRSVDTRVSLPDTMMIYPQLLTYNTSGDLTVQRRWRYNTGGEAVIFTTTGEAAVRVHLEGVPDGTYGVFLDYAQTPQGASVSVWQRQTPLSDWMPTYTAGDTVRVERQFVTDVTLTPLNHNLTVRLKGDVPRNQFWLNRIILVRKEE
jgi:hypothetical protein